jgi:hypothetical protein
MQQSHFKRSTWGKGLQAVLKDSCLDNTLSKSGQGGPLFMAQGDHGVDGGGLVGGERGCGHRDEE